MKIAKFAPLDPVLSPSANIPSFTLLIWNKIKDDPANLCNEIKLPRKRSIQLVSFFHAAILSRSRASFLHRVGFHSRYVSHVTKATRRRFLTNDRSLKRNRFDEKEQRNFLIARKFFLSVSIRRINGGAYREGVKSFIGCNSWWSETRIAAARSNDNDRNLYTMVHWRNISGISVGIKKGAVI